MNFFKLKFCKKLIFSRAKWIFNPSYDYQISHGIELAIETLPYLFKIFPKESNEFYEILLMASFHMRYFGCSAIAIRNYLSNISNEPNKFLDEFINDYIALQPQFEEIEKEVIKENRIQNKSINVFPESIKRLHENYNEYLGNITNKSLKPLNLNLNSLLNLFSNFANSILARNKRSSENADDIHDLNISNLSLNALLKLFLIISDNTFNDECSKIIKEIISIVSEKILIDNNSGDYGGEYMLRNNFLEKLALFILYLDENDIKEFIKPFVDNFQCSKEMNDFLSKFVSVGFNNEKYHQFWEVWDIFYENIKECSKSNSHYSSEIIKTYLLNWPYWPSDFFDWKGLNEKESSFFIKFVSIWALI
ncbi:hypothetical protein [Methanobrevibacter arboriphilus]|uniref:hypothetical protein n=1 Tax=Methanobrevibacter arboriphilus TaxID=39441 RepID=UPI0006D2148F|nr:hypothetical protein [Methanobrevibacter arboriphilus]